MQFVSPIPPKPALLPDPMLVGPGPGPGIQSLSSSISGLATSNGKELSPTVVLAISSQSRAENKALLVPIPPSGENNRPSYLAFDTSTLDAASIAQKTIAELNQYSSAQINKIPVLAIGGLTNNQIVNLASSFIKSLSAPQMGGLTSSQIPSMTVANLNALSGSQISAVNAGAISALTNDQLSSVGSSFVASLSLPQVSYLSGSQIGSLSVANLNTLSMPKVASISSSAISGLKNSQLQGISINFMKGLTATQISNLNSSQIGAISISNLNGMTASQIASIAPASILGLTASQVRSLSSTFLKSLSSSQIGSLSADQISSITAGNLNIFKSGVTVEKAIALASVGITGIGLLDDSKKIIANLSDLKINQSKIATINFTAPVSILQLGYSQYIDSSAVLSKIKSSGFTYQLSGISASAAAGILDANAKISSVTVVDSAANISSNISALGLRNAKISTVTANDSTRSVISFNNNQYATTGTKSILGKISGATLQLDLRGSVMRNFGVHDELNNYRSVANTDGSFNIQQWNGINAWVNYASSIKGVTLVKFSDATVYLDSGSAGVNAILNPGLTNNWQSGDATSSLTISNSKITENVYSLGKSSPTNLNISYITKGIGALSTSLVGLPSWGPNKTYKDVALSGGSGNGATVNISTDARGAITSIVLNNSGDGYNVADQLSISDAEAKRVLNTTLSGKGISAGKVTVASIMNMHDAVINALDYVSSLVNIQFTDVTGTASHADIKFGENNQSASSSAGYATGGHSSQDNPVSLMLANDQSSNTSFNLGSYGWETLIHEIGHTLGLKHPANVNAGGGGTPGPYLPSGDMGSRKLSIMSYSDSSDVLNYTQTQNGNRTSYVPANINPSTYMVYDLAALQFLYGTNTTGVSRNTFLAGSADINKNVDQYQITSFDGSWKGFETIVTTHSSTLDLNSLTGSNIIDMRAGAFSSINILPSTTNNSNVLSAHPQTYFGMNNVALAYGSSFTSINGGAGNDTYFLGSTNSSIIDTAGHNILELGGKQADWTISANGANNVYTNSATGQVATVSAANFTIKYYNVATTSMMHSRLDLAA